MCNHAVIYSFKNLLIAYESGASTILDAGIGAMKK